MAVLQKFTYSPDGRTVYNLEYVDNGKPSSSCKTFVIRSCIDCSGEYLPPTNKVIINGKYSITIDYRVPELWGHLVICKITGSSAISMKGLVAAGVIQPDPAAKGGSRKNSRKRKSIRMRKLSTRSTKK